MRRKNENLQRKDGKGEKDELTAKRSSLWPLGRSNTTWSLLARERDHDALLRRRECGSVCRKFLFISHNRFSCHLTTRDVKVLLHIAWKDILAGHLGGHFQGSLEGRIEGRIERRNLFTFPVELGKFPLSRRKLCLF